jgi:cyclohexyl-isocyanide hydratase
MSQPFTVVFPLFHDVTQLDFTGPCEVFNHAPDGQLMLASTNGGTVQADNGLTFANVRKLADIENCALLCVPGGPGTAAAMDDREYLAQLRRLAAGARYITSVCTGSLLLGAAGLLQGKRAACHWAWRDLLTKFGATPDSARVVRDGNTFSGGGVTAGIDMALTVLAEIAGDDHAQIVQLLLEYAPAPPFDCGRPELAEPPVLAAAQARANKMRPAREAAADRAAAALR